MSTDLMSITRPTESKPNLWSFEFPNSQHYICVYWRKDNLTSERSNNHKGTEELHYVNPRLLSFFCYRNRSNTVIVSKFPFMSKEKHTHLFLIFFKKSCRKHQLHLHWQLFSFQNNHHLPKPSRTKILG